jgi:hypothetical protein
VTALLARLAEDGRVRSPSTELDELHGGARAVGAVCAGVLLVGAISTVRTAVLDRERVSAMGIVTRLKDGSVIHRQNPRLLSLVANLRRGTISDRNGEPIAVTPAGAHATRSYPLAADLGTLVGIHPSRVLLPPWALERALDSRLRGYAERTDGPSYRDVGAGPSTARLPWPDLRPFAPLLALSHDERIARVRAIDAKVEARSIRLSLDARLQREISAILRRTVSHGRGRAAAAVVLAVDSGQVLARAQVPDYDPNHAEWQARMLVGEPDFLARFTGAYGPWPDKTGLQGMYQAGSVGKLFTALAAARRGWTVRGDGCGARVDLAFDCTERDAQGPLFMRPGWPKPIHDHAKDSPHGRLDLVDALAVSCNVYFAQLGLALGTEPFSALSHAGAEIGYGAGRAFEVGAAGSRQLASSAFGQGAMVLNVLQAARLAAAIGSGGHYRHCPPTMELGAHCAEVSLLENASAVLPILAGMRRVMTAGTGRGLSAPPGVRVYGKTGTADVGVFAGEEAFGIRPGQPLAPHSWFVALAEPGAASECQPQAPGRIVVAVVVPRGGTGATTAGPIAMEILAVARSLGYFDGAR